MIIAEKIEKNPHFSIVIVQNLCQPLELQMKINFFIINIIEKAQFLLENIKFKKLDFIQNFGFNPCSIMAFVPK